MNSTHTIIMIVLLAISIGTIYFYNSSQYTDISAPMESDTLQDINLNDYNETKNVDSLFGKTKKFLMDLKKRSGLGFGIELEKALGKNTLGTKSTKPGPSNKERLAVIAYVPNSIGQAYQLLALLYGSWKYIVDHQRELYKDKKDEFAKLNDIDLLVFCHPSICKEMEHVCTRIKKLKEITTTTEQRCWAIEQPFEIDIPYGPLNSFIMFNRTDITELKPRYKYLLRTDNDVFVTPAMYKLKPKVLLHGHGGYSDPFNMKRLKEVAGRLHMTHRGRHAIGSTWCGDTEFFIKAGKKTLETTRYVFLNEFEPTAKGLETIDFKANREGEWIRWWRPVSLLYGGELALNDMITDISDANMGQFDSSSCDKMSIWKTPHIHCWHNDCEFQKFKFMKYLNIAIGSRESLPGDIIHRIVENTYTHDISKMNLQEYSTFIAWNSVSKYLRKWFVKTS